MAKKTISSKELSAILMLIELVGNADWDYDTLQLSIAVTNQYNEYIGSVQQNVSGAYEFLPASS